MKSSSKYNLNKISMSSVFCHLMSKKGEKKNTAMKIILSDTIDTEMWGIKQSGALYLTNKSRARKFFSHTFLKEIAKSSPLRSIIRTASIQHLHEYAQRQSHIQTSWDMGKTMALVKDGVTDLAVSTKEENKHDGYWG